MEVASEINHKPNAGAGLEISEQILHCFLFGKINRTPSADIKTNPLMQKCLRKELPKEMACPLGLTICPSTVPGQDWGVFTTVTLRQGTRLGPYLGERVQPSQMSAYRCTGEHMWEVLGADGSLSHYIDGSRAGCGNNWMSAVNCARFSREQNLALVQEGMDLYYGASQDIAPGSELLVWYGESYNKFFGIPDPLRPSNYTAPSKRFSEDAHAEISRCGERIKCIVCGKVFNSRSNLRSHMRTHTQDKPFSCQFCQRKFSQSSTLRNHVRLHTGERPYRCESCCRSYSQLAGLRAHQKSARHKQPLLQSPYKTVLHG